MTGKVGLNRATPGPMATNFESRYPQENQPHRNPMNNLVLTTLSDGIASICLNRPEALNALEPALATEFLQAARWASASDARVILIFGAGRGFCAGGDLAYIKGEDSGHHGRLEALIDPMHAAVRQLAQATQPIIVSLQGGVAGAGMSLALGADLAIAADNTVFNLAYTKVAVTTDCGGSWYLPRLVGMRRALEIALLGDRLHAHQALRLGLVNWVVAADALQAETTRLVRRVAELHRRLRVSNHCSSQPAA